MKARHGTNFELGSDPFTTGRSDTALGWAVAQSSSRPCVLLGRDIKKRLQAATSRSNHRDKGSTSKKEQGVEAERLTEKPAWLCHVKAELLWMEKTKRWKKQILEVISTAAGGSLIVTEG